MSTEPPSPGPGQPPEDDPFRKQPPSQGGGGSPYGGRQDPYGNGPGNPYDTGGTPPPYGGGGGGGPYGSDPYGGGPYGADPLAGMPPLADGGKRVMARIIDIILVSIVVGLLSWAFNIAEFKTSPDKIQFGKQFAESVLAAVLYIGYDTILMTRTGQTLGKRLFKLRVADLSNGATPSVQTNLARAAVLWLPAVFCCACIWIAISGGWSFFDKPYRQGLHDKAAKTVVVSTG
ncbi:RDD family protein [Streptomyces sp. NPDC046821]|uniref:RDD family protein n=1 Tax=Streptomyces sp. NPDC046821 TaxID=3154702 RepID=UPI0033D61C34